MYERCPVVRAFHTSFKPSGRGGTLSGLGLLGTGILLVFRGALCPLSQFCSSECILHVLSLRAGSLCHLTLSSSLVPGSGDLLEMHGLMHLGPWWGRVRQRGLRNLATLASLQGEIQPFFSPRVEGSDREEKETLGDRLLCCPCTCPLPANLGAEVARVEDSDSK